MLECLILGDSIAVGVGQARPACMTVARTGVSSGAFLQTLLPLVPRAAGSVIISLGVNDDPSMATLDNLRRLRNAVSARQVTWLLPGLKPEVRRHVREVALERRDRLLDTAPEAGPDKLHPTGEGYRLIANWAEQRGPQLPDAGGQLAPRHAGLGRPGAAMLPRIATPTAMPLVNRSLYASWPPANSTFAAIPPRDYAYRAFTPSLPRPVVR